MKEHHQDEGEKELGNTHADEADEGEDVVGDGVLARRRIDTDGDGISDAQEAQGSGGLNEALEEVALSPEEAERYLQGLEEDRPKRRHKGGAKRRSEKDW